MFDSHERGRKLGIYYIGKRTAVRHTFPTIPLLKTRTRCSAPLLGPSLGALLGGALTSADNWRATFYFLAAVRVQSVPENV
jgi:MFS family permease